MVITLQQWMFGGIGKSKPNADSEDYLTQTACLIDAVDDVRQTIICIHSESVIIVVQVVLLCDLWVHRLSVDPASAFSFGPVGWKLVQACPRDLPALRDRNLLPLFPVGVISLELFLSSA